MRKRYRWIVDVAAKRAEQELRSRGYTGLTQEEIRPLVRKAIREVRRWRVGLSVRDVLGRPAGASYLAWYIIRKNENNRSKNEKEKV
jgi:hypothetical protein